MPSAIEKKVDVGEALAAEIKARTGFGTMSSDLTYDLRSGDPDSIDRLVAITFANIALDLLSDGVTGKMVGVRKGRYAALEIPEQMAGPRQLDVDVLYNKKRYRPQLLRQAGSPDAAGLNRLTVDPLTCTRTWQWSAIEPLESLWREPAAE